jgi:hypothetical protein
MDATGPAQVVSTRRVYVAGALTGLDEETAKALKGRYEAVAGLCESLGLQAYVPHLRADPIMHPKLTPREVYLLDTENLMSAELVIVFADVPSHGVGIEVEYAAREGSEIILLYPRGVPVSRMLLGHPSVVAQITYTDWEQALAQLWMHLIGYRRWRTSLGRGVELELQQPTSISAAASFWNARALCFALPLKFNDGTNIPRDVFVRLEDALTARFGGCTRLDSASGAWRTEGRTFREQNALYLVLVRDESFSVLELITFRAALMEQFRQLDVFMMMMPAHWFS